MKHSNKSEQFDSFIKHAEVQDEKWRKDYVEALLRYWSQETGSLLEKFSDTSWEEHFPQWKHILERLHKENTFRSLAVGNQNISGRITQEVLDWFREAGKKLLYDDPFLEERTKYKQISQKTSPVDWHNLVKKVEEMYPEYSQVLWQFYAKKYDELKQEEKSIATLEKNKKLSKSNKERKRKISEELQALRRKLLEDWRKLLWKKTVQNEQEILDQSFTRLIHHLNFRCAKFQEFRKNLEGFFRYFGRSWDLSEGVWRNVNWEELEYYADLLEKKDDIKKLAELLGKLSHAQNKYKTATLQKENIGSKWRVSRANKSEIMGIHYSDDISNILPSELALLTSPITEILFAKNFVEKKLLTWEYQGLEQIQKKEKQGPIIICVDTSGSMSGNAEQIAKTITLAIINIALRDRRNCYLISFSKKIETLDLSDLDQALGKLVQFLSMSFYGGTDIFPPLQASLKMLQTKAYEQADVLVISDFIFEKIPNKLEQEIEKQQKEKQTRFHSLAISYYKNPEFIKIFDNKWIYHISTCDDFSGIIEKLVTVFPKA